MTERIVTLKIEADEGSWHLHLSTDFVDYDFVLPADVALDLAGPGTEALRQWGSWADVPSRRPLDDMGMLDDAYPLDDPKRDSYFEHAATRADLDRKRAKGE